MRTISSMLKREPILKKLFIIIVFFISLPLGAKMMVFENFTIDKEKDWKFISDQVMGGVSDGKLEFINMEGYSFARMTGYVSLENNGGFIQFRKEVNGTGHNDSKGLVVNVRGNNQKYFLHIRTTGTILPWQYYQAPFEVTQDWKKIKIAYDIFERSGIMLSKKVKPKKITSIAIVAFGFEQEVLIDVNNIYCY